MSSDKSILIIGGGLPTSVMSGRRLIQSVCKEDRKKFTRVEK